MLFAASTGEDELNLCEFNRLKEFNATGKLITSWGEKGTQDGRFIHTLGIAVGSEEYVLVTMS